MSFDHSTPQHGNKLLRASEVCDRLGRSVSSLYRDVAAGLIPAPVKIGGAARWPEAEIEAVIARAIAERDGTRAAA